MPIEKFSTFRCPRPVKITGRSSTITNSFVNCIIPVIVPSNQEIDSALRILDINPKNVTCIYCGNNSTEWDHLRPIVRGKRPTGYITEIANLVPACSKCNQSKSGTAWREWMTGSAILSPKSRGITDIESRIERLDAYEKWRDPIIIQFEELIPSSLWKQHWDNHDRLQAMMRKHQATADEIRAIANRKLLNKAGQSAIISGLDYGDQTLLPPCVLDASVE